MQEEDHESLAAGVVEFTNFDSIEMAQMCEKHPLLQVRRPSHALRAQRPERTRARTVAC